MEEEEAVVLPSAEVAVQHKGLWYIVRAEGGHEAPAREGEEEFAWPSLWQAVAGVIYLIQTWEASVN